MFKIRLLALLFAISLSPKPVLAEIDLGGWKTHAAMAEQGAVCGAFADLMAMQTLVDEKVGRLWSERRAYSGSIIRRAAELEGRQDVDNDAIDDLLNRYSMWLLNNLANPANAEILDPAARDAASNMIGDVCAGLYAQADRAILKRHPSLGACAPGAAPVPALSGSATEEPAACPADSAIVAATTIKQAEDTVADMLRRLQAAQARTDDLSNEVAVLQIDNGRLLREIDANRITTTKVDDLTTANAQLRTKIASLETERKRLAATAAEMQDTQQQNIQLTARMNGLKEDLQGLMKANGQLDAEMVDLTTRHAAALARLEALSTDRDRMAGELAVAAATLESVTGRNQGQVPDDKITARDTASDAARDTDAAGADGVTGMADDLALLDADMAPAPAPASASAPASAPAGSDRSDPDRATESVAAAPAQNTGIETERSFVAQLGAFSSRTGALSEISRIQTHFPGNNALTALQITPSQRNDGTSIFRITTGRMPVEDAQRLCNELWSGMVSCMLRAAR